jgi:hypothetical protein
MELLKLLSLLVFNTRGLDRSSLKSSRAGEPNQPDDVHVAIPDNPNKEILYESFIPVDAIIFISEMNSLSKGVYDDLINKTVMEAKDLLLSDPANFHAFDNYATKVTGENKRLKGALELRNRYLNADKSLIARGLVMEEHKKLRGHIEETELGLKREDSDEKYRRMMDRLYGAKYADDGVYMAIQRERREFYRSRVNIAPDEAQDARISLSLGGPIFVPGLLAAVLRSLNIGNKTEMVTSALRDILAPVEELHLLLMHRSCTERKDLILSFLASCLHRRTDVFKEKIDRGYETRSKMLGLYLRNDGSAADKLKLLDELQEKEIKRLIVLYENMDDRHLFIRLNRAIIEAYARWLDDGQRESEKKLREFFKE